jgi:hypothetical protein
MSDRLMRVYIVCLVLLFAALMLRIRCAGDRRFACGGYDERTPGCN